MEKLTLNKKHLEIIRGHVYMDLKVHETLAHGETTPHPRQEHAYLFFVVCRNMVKVFTGLPE